MLPYAGTPIEGRLAKEGRLRGSVDSPDYDFVDARLNPYFEALNECVSDWIQGADGLANQLNFAWQEYWVIRRLFPPVAGLQAYESFLRSLTSRSNAFLLNKVEETSRAFESGVGQLPSVSEFHAARSGFADQLLRNRDAFILQNQEVLFEWVSGPVLPPSRSGPRQPATRSSGPRRIRLRARAHREAPAVRAPHCRRADQLHAAPCR